MIRKYSSIAKDYVNRFIADLFFEPLALQVAFSFMILLMSIYLQSIQLTALTLVYAAGVLYYHEVDHESIREGYE